MHDSDTPTSTLTLDGPAALLLELPALIGFVPRDSLVAVLFDQRLLRATLRWDLDHDLVEAVIRTIGVAHRAEADSLVLVAYTDRGVGDLPLRGELDRAVDLVEEQGLTVRDVLLVDTDRWWSYYCDDPGCCPQEGRALPAGTPLLDAQRAYTGRRTVAVSRDAASEPYRVDPARQLPPEALQGAVEALAEASPWKRATTAVDALHSLAHHAEVDRAAEDRQGFLRAVVGVAVQDVTVRDYLLATTVDTCPDLVPVADALVQVALTVPDAMRPAVAAAATALLAAEGSSAVALWCMADLAPEESLTRLVRASVEAGYPPEELRDLLRTALPEVTRRLTQA